MKQDTIDTITWYQKRVFELEERVLELVIERRKLGDKLELAELAVELEYGNDNSECSCDGTDEDCDCSDDYDSDDDDEPCDCYICRPQPLYTEPVYDFLKSYQYAVQCHVSHGNWEYKTFGGFDLGTESNHTAIDEVKTLSGSELDPGYHSESIAGLKDPGELKFNIKYVPTNPPPTYSIANKSGRTLCVDYDNGVFTVTGVEPDHMPKDRAEEKYTVIKMVERLRDEVKWWDDNAARIKDSTPASEASEHCYGVRDLVRQANEFLTGYISEGYVNE